MNHECRRPSVMNMDFDAAPLFGNRNPVPIVNRFCLTCRSHWYGNAETNIVEIPARIWDKWMEDAP